MPDLVLGHDDQVTVWVADQLGLQGWTVYTPAIGVAREGQLIAGVVYHDFRRCIETKVPLDIQATIASTDPRWASKDVLYAIFAYPYLQLDVQRITTLCNADDEHVVKFNQRLGFKKESVLKRGWSVNHNAILWRMLREECRWIRETPHKKAA